MPLSQPQVRVSISGQAVAGVLSAEIQQVAYFAADRFTVVFGIGASLETGAAFFAALGPELVTIDVAAFSAGFVTLLTGQIDNVEIDLLRNTATITGRDLSAGLIDTEIAQTFANQTSSQIATGVANRHGLTPNVTATKTPVGQYYDLDHARSGLGLNSRAGTEWNLLSWLALVEGFALSVTGTTLNFGPLGNAASISLSPQGCIELSLQRVTALPNAAVVKSWNTRNKSVTTQAAGAGGGLTTTLIRPNLTEQQAMSIAANCLSYLSQHKTMISVVMPGELTLLPGSTIVLSQTGSDFDRSYAVDTIRRSISSRLGFTQSVRAHDIT